MGFDTSLFAVNDPQLAKQVENISVFFDGMDEVRISWIDAKALVKQASSYLKEIEAFVNMLSNGRENVPYYRFLQEMAIQKHEFRHFMSIVKMSNKFYYGKSYDSVRVVYYATADAESRA